MSDLKNRLASLKPGAIVRITNYVDGDKRAGDLTVQLLGRDGYKDLLREDLKILTATTADQINLPGVEPEDASKAYTAMVEAKKKSLSSPKSDRAPSYESVGTGSLATLNNGLGGVYLLGLKVIGAVVNPKPAKGLVPRAKQLISQNLDLPTRRYKHAANLVPGKFESVAVLSE